LNEKHQKVKADL